MIWLYLSSLVFGGIFVGLSVFSGLGDHDAEFDKDVEFDKDIEFDKDFEFDKEFEIDIDGDMDVDGDADLDGDGDTDFEKDIEIRSSKKRYMPFFSFKFYTFSMAFFGLTGAFLEFTWGNTFGVLALSMLMGAIAGFGMTYLLHAADQSVGGKMLGDRDYVGSSAQVVLPVSNSRAGKVKLRIKGQLVEMRAEAYTEDDEFVLDFGEECFVIAVENGVAKVMHPDQFKQSS